MFPKKYLRRGLIILFWLFIWQLVALWVDNVILLVTPFKVLEALGKLLIEVTFWSAITTTLGKVALGFCIGVAVALLLAVLSFRWKVMEELIAPFIMVVKTVPVVSFVILLLIWYGASKLSVVICFLVVLPGVYLNTIQGLRSADAKLLEMGKVFSIKGMKRVLYIYRPAVYPFLKSGLKLALGMCWKAGVAAEVIGVPKNSLGERLYLSKIYLDTAGVLAWTVVIILLSVAFERGVLWLVDVFFAWNPEKLLFEHKNEISEKREHPTGRLECVEVSKRFGERTVYEKLNASYEKGSVHYLKGASGSGKTTLLRLFCGLEKPDGGSVVCDGTVSMMFQEDRLCEEYSAICNVALVTGNLENAKEALRKLLDEEALDKPCKYLSGGMKRRVALVRAMEADKDIVLLDEPFTGMDPATIEHVTDYIRERRQGRTMVIATHIDTKDVLQKPITF